MYLRRHCYVQGAVLALSGEHVGESFGIDGSYRLEAAMRRETENTT